MKIRALSALVYLMGGLIALTLAVSFASWIIRPSSAQEASTTTAQGTPSSEVPLPPPPENIPAPTAIPNAVPVVPDPTSAQQPAAATQPTPTNVPPPQPNAAGQVPPPPVGANPTSTLNLPARDFLEPYIFDAREGRRNPFRPLNLAADEDPSAVGPSTPLELYEVDDFKLLAIMWDVKNPRALLMDPNKEIHVVNKDDRIGRKKGYIATIREGEVVVVETGEFNGEAIYSTRIMQLPK